MKNKYYTPTIEEFHVGFDFEVNYGKEWVKESLWAAPQVVTLPYMKLENIRVKYLDREDIESLGWTPHKSNETLYFNGNHILLYREEEHEISIAIVDSSKDKGMMINLRSNEVFKITIKNKSELKRLLKQLRIQ